ncbi:MAG: protein phosphatase 2C domain-containing protein [Oscillochloridaceae bacterium]|nr:protein phosphatase 2C domain-containing protein [Chloroflexaceae bacterium]MDW8390470.1 protein phosphatase 2C domain-containing protein [Oscillochloridaceae bacterium]
MRVRYSARTHPGKRREVNQDAYGVRQFGEATLLVVCDGMGGHAAGEVASARAVEAIIAAFDPAAPPAEALRAAFVSANARVYAEGHGAMGTTGVAALLVANQLFVANVGDSRAYLVREEQIRQISRDHSFVSDQIAAGLITPEEARASLIRNIITRALGHSARVEVDVFVHPLQAGDTVVLSTDGLHGLVSDEEIAAIAGLQPPDQAAQQLVERANELGGIDNITVVVAQIDELDGRAARAEPSAAMVVEPPAPPLERPLSRLGLALAALTLLVLLGVGGILWAMPVEPPLPAPAASSTPSTPTP